MTKKQMLAKLGLERLHSWQEGLLDDSRCSNRLIRIPTGFGKTLGVLTSWIWNRVLRNDDTWPRRLVWCLPMRVLVEQTEAEVRRVLASLDLLWDGAPDRDGRVGVHQLMGGASAGGWHLFPEGFAVLIGTQDMLLSRALNRGYGAARARWPMDFGLLNQDALWVMDEVQLMDVGLATSAQLQAFRAQSLPGRHAGALRPCKTWWMSATLQDDWLKSVDTHPLLASLPPRVEIPAEQRTGGLWAVTKSRAVEPVGEDKTGKGVCDLVIQAHAKQGGLTLVVMNTVDAAVAIHQRLAKETGRSGIDLCLVHSRFRPAERETWRDDFLNKHAAPPPEGRIIVSTQVIEAGVDISAKTLITELAPWPSLVQRFGRCARYPGEHGKVIVLDRGWTDKDEKKALPYALTDLREALAAVRGLTDVAPASLERFEEGLSDKQRAALYPYEAQFLLLSREWRELFDTSPDLSGADLDISRYIRTGDENDCLVFWRDIPDEGPSDDWKPRRPELCPVPFMKAREWLCAKEHRVKRKERAGKSRPIAWAWDWLDGCWNPRTERTQIIPGAVILVDASEGGYSTDAGWDPATKPPKQGSLALDPPAPPSRQDQTDSAEARDDLSQAEWQSIAQHCRDVAYEAALIAADVGLPPRICDLIRVAGMAHDLGKASPYFQGSIDQTDAPAELGGQLAKAPQRCWRKQALYQHEGETRKGFRHELASALALFDILQQCRPDHPGLLDGHAALFDAQAPSAATDRAPDPDTLPLWLDLGDTPERRDFDLVAYLVASHHGKVRCSMQSSPTDQAYVDRDGRGMPIRGVRDQDGLPLVTDTDGDDFAPATALTLEPAKLGLSPITGPSWTERVLGLVDHYGPDVLGYLEAILRAADVRVSAGIPAPDSKAEVK